MNQAAPHLRMLEGLPTILAADHGRDQYGQPVRRSKREFPYAYDFFVVWRGGTNEAATGNVYSDRMFQQDPAKFQALSANHFKSSGQSWSQRRPKAVEAFLRDWMDDPALKLVLIMEGCNVSNGAPVWWFSFKAGMPSPVA